MNRFFAEWAEQNDPVQDERSRTDDAESQHAPDAVTPKSGRRFGRRWQASGAVLLAAAGVVAALAVVPAQQALADPSANDWYRLRMCESGNNYRINTGNDHYGAYQFDLVTWHGVGGKGYPQNASPAEQDARALILYRLRGWQPWTCASILGLQPDSDAGSGRIGDIHVPTSGRHHRHHRHHRHDHGVPVYPSNRSFFFGDTSNVIKRFQNQMHRRGAIPAGTGYYGPLTRKVVLRLQRQNGINDSGLLGPLTWHAAFAGTYVVPGAHHPRRHHHKHRHNSRHTRHHRTTAPRYPASRSFFFGDTSNVIKRFQDQMHRRGAIPAGTGYYGPLTRKVVLRLQRQNGINDSGLLGPLTWRAAWEGKYRR
jgi:peptidoglycan hydrolase-like protein with peptidoglycan-binding domain